MIHFQLVTSKGLQFDDDIYEVSLPTSAGSVGILEDHMPLISHVTPGVITIHKTTGEIHSFATLGGIIEVDGKVARLLADDVAATETINESDAEGAVRNAEELVKNANSKVDLEEARRQLQYSSIRLNLARSKKSKR